MSYRTIQKVEDTLLSSKKSPWVELREIWDELSDEGRDEIAVWCEAVIEEVGPRRNFGVGGALELLWLRMKWAEMDFSGNVEMLNRSILRLVKKAGANGKKYRQHTA